LLSDPALAKVIKDYGRPLVASACRDIIENARGGTEIADYPSAVNEYLANRFIPQSIINATGDPLHFALPFFPVWQQPPEMALTDTAPVFPHSGETLALVASALGFPVSVLAANLISALGLVSGLLRDDGVKALIVARREMVRLQSGNVADLCRALSIDLLEVGTSNKARAEDYSLALQESADKPALLTVRSPFVQIQGFSDCPDNQEMAQIAQRHKSPRLLILDGALPSAPEGLPLRNELCLDRSTADGFDIIIVNGYGLLGLTDGALVIGQGEWGDKLKSQRLAEGYGIWLAGCELTSLVSAQLVNYCRRGWERLHPALSPLYQDEKKEKGRAAKFAKLLRPSWSESKAQRIAGFCLGEMRPGWAVELGITEPIKDRLRQEGVYYLAEGNRASFFVRTLGARQIEKLTHILSETGK
jgi:hypothetical protein